MSLSHLHPGSLSLRGFAICLVWMLTLLLGQASVEATCGDYLMSHGEQHQHAVIPDQSSHLPAGSEFPFKPSRCPNGDCHSHEETPAPVGSTSDTRIVDEVRLFGWLNTLNSPSHGKSAAHVRPVDEPLPESPFNAELERPPQFSSV